MAVLTAVASVSFARAASDDPLAANDPIDAIDSAAPLSRWTWFGDLLARYDHVSGLPANREDLSRGRARARFGVDYALMPELEAGAAIKAAAGSDENRDNRRNNDNERSRAIGLDQLFVRWHPSETAEVALGKRPLPLELTPLVWDTDLRPTGVSGVQAFALGDYDRLSVVGGYFEGSQRYGDRSKLAAAQIGWRIHEGAPRRATFLLGFLHFSDLDRLALQGLARTNSVLRGRFLNNYHLVDLQAVGTTEIGGWPLELRVDAVRNVAADVARDGLRGSAILGTARRAGGIELGLSAQRIQRDAVLAAMNSDDWWFHSAARGVMPWVAYGVDANWWLRLAFFHERRDGLDEHTDRVLLDLNASF